MAFEIDERLPVVLENEIGFDHLQIVLEDILKVDIDEKIREFRKLGKRLYLRPIFLTTSQHQFCLSCLRQMKKLKELRL